MITEDYVSFETAKLLKEKGFDEETRGYYPIKGDATGRLMFGCEYNHNHSQVQISAPTLQMAMKWLREVHNVHTNPIQQGNYNDSSEYYSWIVARNGVIYRNQSVSEKFSYEEACEAAIKYCLENLI